MSSRGNIHIDDRDWDFGPVDIQTALASEHNIV